QSPLGQPRALELAVKIAAAMPGGDPQRAVRHRRRKRRDMTRADSGSRMETVIVERDLMQLDAARRGIEAPGQQIPTTLDERHTRGMMRDARAISQAQGESASSIDVQRKTTMGRFRPRAEKGLSACRQ